MVELTTSQKNALYRVVTGIRDDGLPEIKLGGYAGTGKASANSAVVYTPFGPKPMGEIKVGDQVANPDGSVARVIGVFPQGKRPVFKVTCIDGSSTRVTGDHLWLFSLASKKYKSAKSYLGAWGRLNWEVNTTEYLRQYLSSERRKRRPSWPLLPLTKPVKFTIVGSKERLRLDPYLLGLLLGDGCFRSSTVAFSSNAGELVLPFLEAGYQISPKTGTNELDYAFTGDSGLQLRDELVKLGLWGKYSHEKFVPVNYLHADIESRRAILQGLMDTDGGCDENGGCEFSSTSKQLGESVQWLVRSLGGKATMTEKPSRYRDEAGFLVECRTSYRLYIQIEERSSLFRLVRKVDRCPKAFNGGRSNLKNRIVDIVSDGEEECTCIQVDHPNSLYVTDDFVVTHNTSIIRYLVKFFPYFKVCAFTGKAANVLRKKEISDANTIHSTIYRPVIENNVVVEYRLAMYHELGAEGFIVDEASMVSKDIYDDMASFGSPFDLRRRPRPA
jgi:hypothetical protein